MLAPVLALIYACTGSDPQYMPVDPDPADSGGGGPVVAEAVVYWSERGTATSNTGAIKRIKP